MIKETIEGINKLMEQIEKLQTKSGEESLEQQKALEVQLAGLNSQTLGG